MPLRQQRHLEVLALGLCRLNEGRTQAPLGWRIGWRACDFSVFFFSVEAPPTGNVVPGEVYLKI